MGTPQADDAQKSYRSLLEGTMSGTSSGSFSSLLCFRSMYGSKRFIPLLAILISVPMMLGACSNLSNTEKGAIIGGSAGAAGGAAVGNATGGTAEGAIIGAVIGGTAGAIIGNQMDRKAKELDEEIEGAEVERVGEGIKVTFDSGLLFGFDSSALQAEAEQNLSEFATSMNEFEETKILIVGHTDAKGSESYNLSLSERRAQSAADYLTKEGVAGSRIQAEGKGELEPVATNETVDGRTENRRVEIAIFASEEYKEQAKQQASAD